ncbi:nucleotidyltransferase family protein [Methanobacterium petrolearium]|uniref:nucleotidyltransferase family protein n=1 Tax=Methanobacterium petrolearium TaxID=710190 RepID=UPI001AE150C8|nr:NTP transferase domain-containing protein [Methanobacterium petrolearium]MBP1946170.1 molybdenum cofactor cytidylyltransferase [Methanobacterium petrolearium]BDZ70685.1 glycosyl transferase [Methanobacterium petrolearium]
MKKPIKIHNVDVSCIVTAAGKNRRMREDLQSKGMDIQHKLLFKINGEHIINYTVKKALQTEIKECVVVLGHFMDELYSALEHIEDPRLKIIENPDVNVELSQTLVNGVLNAKYDYCLCLAGDQPTVTTETMQNLVNQLLRCPEPENSVSILARGKTGYLDSAKGLGMPFACHCLLLEQYLHGEDDNLNPILRKMVADGVSLYGVHGQNELELININRYDDYLKVLEKME